MYKQKIVGHREEGFSTGFLWFTIQSNIIGELDEETRNNGNQTLKGC